MIEWNGQVDSSEGLSRSIHANTERWSAEDHAWRGYHFEGDRIVFDDRIRKGLNLLLSCPAAQYLDVGCANGTVARAFSKRLNAASTTGVDCLERGPKGMRFIRVNLDSMDPLPFEDYSFDVVTCFETLEHVHDTDRLLGEIRRILRPNGYALISVPRLDALLNLLLLTFNYLPPAVECSLRWRHGAPERNTRVSGHVSYFTKRSLFECIECNKLMLDKFVQASIYSAWRYARMQCPPLSQRIPLRMLSWIPFKQDVMIVRVRPAEIPSVASRSA